MIAAAEPDLLDIMLNEDARFVAPANDVYWPREQLEGRYEPEIGQVLRRASGRPFDFFDAGANYGYWSVLASSAPFGRHRVVAIEASQGNFRQLVKNAAVNGGRFHVLHRAVLDESGRDVRLYGKKHWGLSLRKDWHPGDADQYEDIESITLDDVAARYFPVREYPPFVKIDVEGSEIEAIKGAGRLIDDGALIVYEDHAKEPSHRISRFVMSLEGFEIWYVGSNGATRITALDQVEAVKTNPRAGYNFFSYRRPSPWSSLFEEYGDGAGWK